MVNNKNVHHINNLHYYCDLFLNKINIKILILLKFDINYFKKNYKN